MFRVSNLGFSAHGYTSWGVPGCCLSVQTYLDLQVLLLLLLCIDRRQQVPQVLVVNLHHAYLHTSSQRSWRQLLVDNVLPCNNAKPRLQRTAMYTRHCTTTDA